MSVQDAPEIASEDIGDVPTSSNSIEVVSFLTSAQNDDFFFLAKEFANFLCRKAFCLRITRRASYL